MKKLFLGVFFPFNKLDIVDENNIDSSILLSKPLHAVAAYSRNQIVCKLLGRDIGNASAAVNIETIVTD